MKRTLRHIITAVIAVLTLAVIATLVLAVIYFRAHVGLAAR